MTFFDSMKKLAYLIAIACAFSSCGKLGVDNWQEIVSNSSFGQMLNGKVDQNHSWNLATRAHIDVKAGKDGIVEIYGLSGGKSCLLARYKAVMGINTFEFDLAYGVQNVYVASYGDRKVLEGKVGSSVDFTKNTSTKTVFTDAGTAFTVSELDSYKEFLNIGSFVADAHNTTKQGLFTTDNGHFTLHPVHFQQNYTDKGMFTYGIYYQKDGNLVYQPVYSPDNQEFTQIRHSDPNGSWVGDWTNCSSNGTWSGNDRRSKGIVVNVPAGVKFGFYVRMLDWGGEFTVYSEADRNQDSMYDQWNKREVAKTEYTSFWTEGINDYLSFRAEASAYNDSYNGMVFASEGLLKADGSIADVVDTPRESSSWILSCEDLGSKADCDFNDIVYRIEYVAGEQNAKVTPLAAGGTIPAYLMYKGKIYGPEIHASFGKQTKEMANTYKGVAHVDAESFTVPVGSDFTMSSTDMGGFAISVGEGKQSVIASTEDTIIPYMICIPGSYRWSLERVAIADAYPDFAFWCADHTAMTDWYCRPVEDLVY